MNLVTELHAITAALHAERLRYAVVGGLAVTMHGAVRTTRDIDLIISTSVFAGLLDDTVEVVISEGTLRVISREGLIKMKQLAGRDQDLADLARLEDGDD